MGTPAEEAAAFDWLAGTGERANTERCRLEAAGARLVGWDDASYPNSRRTIAVLATGIDLVSPAWHAELAREIARAAAVLTELACGTPALPFRFHRRNLLLSPLTLGVVVVEAPEGSGALLTAQSAVDRGRSGGRSTRVVTG